MNVPQDVKTFKIDQNFENLRIANFFEFKSKIEF